MPWYQLVSKVGSLRIARLCGFPLNHSAKKGTSKTNTPNLEPGLVAAEPGAPTCGRTNRSKTVMAKSYASLSACGKPSINLSLFRHVPSQTLTIINNSTCQQHVNPHDWIADVLNIIGHIMKLECHRSQLGRHELPVGSVVQDKSVLW